MRRSSPACTSVATTVPRSTARPCTEDGRHVMAGLLGHGSSASLRPSHGSNVGTVMALRRSSPLHSCGGSSWFRPKISPTAFPTSIPAQKEARTGPLQSIRHTTRSVSTGSLLVGREQIVPVWRGCTNLDLCFAQRSASCKPKSDGDQQVASTSSDERGQRQKRKGLPG